MEKTKTGRAAQDADKYVLRLPEGMREQISEAAKASGRSMNAEIIARLQSSFEPLDVSSLSWVALLKLIQDEASKHGATITIQVK